MSKIFINIFLVSVVVFHTWLIYHLSGNLLLAFTPPVSFINGAGFIENLYWYLEDRK